MSDTPDKPLSEQLAVLVRGRDAAATAYSEGATTSASVRAANQRLLTFLNANESAILELMRDGERYRWLRVNSTQPAEGWSTHSNPESLDAAIDSAMKKDAPSRSREMDKTGGPAFPGQCDHGGGQVESWTGMTLRDYFATKAMQSILTHYSEQQITDIGQGVLGFKYGSNAAYVIADAMLAEREKNG